VVVVDRNANYQLESPDPRDPETMWILLLAAYILTGIVIVTFTSAKDEMPRLDDFVLRPRRGLERMRKVPAWKIVACFTLLYGITIVGWPLFLSSWFPRREKRERKSVASVPKPDIPKEWLRGQLTDEEAAERQWEFRGLMQEGDEIWKYCSPPQSWERLAGRAGIALVRNGEIVASRLTMLN
jgi:hypothetical protein